MAKEVTYRVTRQHIGDKLYMPGDERTADEQIVQHLVTKGILVPATVSKADPGEKVVKKPSPKAKTKAEPVAENKMEPPPENKGEQPDSEPEPVADPSAAPVTDDAKVQGDAGDA